MRLFSKEIRKSLSIRKAKRRRQKKLLKVKYMSALRMRYGGDQPGNKWIEKILAHHDDRQIAFIDSIVESRDWLGRIALEEPKIGAAAQPYWNNAYLPALDAMTIYTLAMQAKPATYVEIGSGNSTKFARRAITDHDLATKIISIDPQPRAEIDAISDTVIRQGLEEVDLTLFDGLAEGDMVFMDGSHVCLQNSDVTVFFLEVLPRLKKGVIVGIHDILWPNDYPEEWFYKNYSEQYVLGAYMLAQGLAFPLIFASAYAEMRFWPRILQALPQETFEAIKAKGGGAVWFHS